MDRVNTPIASGDPRRHHYLPQFLLRRFADGRDQVAIVRLAHPTAPRVTNIKNAAIIRDLYLTVNDEVGETVAVERVLAEADGEAARIIQEMLEAGKFPQGEDRAHLSIWLGFLHTRGPFFRRQMEAMADQVTKLGLSLMSEPDAARAELRRMEAREPTEDEVSELMELAGNLDRVEIAPHQNTLVSQMLELGRDLGLTMLDRYYAVVTLTELGLALPDRPIFLYQRPENRHPLAGVGFGTADEIWVPLARRTLLVLHSDPSIGDMFATASPEMMADKNQGFIHNAWDEIYCHPDDAARITQLEMPSPERPLFGVGGAHDTPSDGVNDAPSRRAHRRYRRTTDGPLQ